MSDRTLIELNTIEAHNAYSRARLSTFPRQSHAHLFVALEKAINADFDRKGDKFDQEVRCITGLPLPEIKELREFNNRAKHSVDTRQRWQDFVDFEVQLPKLSSRLNMATDIAILSRV